MAWKLIHTGGQTLKRTEFGVVTFTVRCFVRLLLLSHFIPHAPKPEARGGGREDQPHLQGAVAAQAQEGLCFKV